MQPKFPSLEQPSPWCCFAFGKRRTSLPSFFTCFPFTSLKTDIFLPLSSCSDLCFSSLRISLASSLLGKCCALFTPHSNARSQCSIAPPLQSFYRRRWLAHLSLLFSIDFITQTQFIIVFSSSYFTLAVTVRTRWTKTAHFVCRARHILSVETALEAGPLHPVLGRWHSKLHPYTPLYGGRAWWDETASKCWKIQKREQKSHILRAGLKYLNII